MRQKSVDAVTCSNAYELSMAPQRLFDIDVVEYYQTRLAEKKKQLEKEVENFGKAIKEADQISLWHGDMEEVV